MFSRNFLFAYGLFLLAACHSAAGPGGTSDNNDTSSKFVNQSGRALDASTLHDPIADTFVHGTGAVPTTFTELVTVLFDAQQGMSCLTQIALVSERAQLRGKPDAFRTVMMRTCGNKQVLLSPLQSIAAGDQAPSDVEIMAFDDAQNAYDFYALEGGSLRFMGSSIDMLAGPGNGTGAVQERRCANCHTGGGPIMKELVLPWANWDGPQGIHFNGGTTSPGSDVVFRGLVAALGIGAAGVSHATGDALQSVVQSGNQAWNQTRLATLAANDTQSLLKPLFCTTEVNLQTFPTLHAPMGAVPPDALVNDTEFNVFDAPTVVMNGSDYATLVAAHQQVLDADGARLVDSDGKPLVDTAFAFNHPFASFADNDYIEKLKKVTSSAFVNAVMAVDFTTPVFSGRRCGLLKHAPAIPADVQHPDVFAKALTDGFVQNLMASSPVDGSPESELLTNLQSRADPQPRITSFLTACSNRAKADSPGFGVDLLKVQSLLRRKFRALPIFEHRELLPEDDFASPDGTRLDPVDCTIKE
jgi:hypothetical protein